MNEYLYKIGDTIHLKDKYVEAVGLIKGIDEPGSMSYDFTIYDVEITLVLKGEPDEINMNNDIYWVFHSEVIGKING